MVQYDEKLDQEVVELIENHPFTAGKILTSKKKKYLLEYVMSCTPNFDSTYNLKTRLWAVKFHRIEQPKCKICGKVLRFHNLQHSRAKTFEDGFNKYCSIECEFEDEEIFKKQKITNLEKYGCEWTFQSENNKEKSKNTMIGKYGVEYAQQAPEIHKRAEMTRMKLYGNKDYPNSKIGKEKIFNVTCERFYQKNLQQNSFVVPLFLLDEYKQHLKDGKHLYHWKCNECGKEFYARLSTSWFKQGCVKSYSRCPNCYPEKEGCSSEEIAFVKFLNSISRYKFMPNVRILHDSSNKKSSFKEIDAYCEELKLGFEYDGIFFHSLERNAIDKKSVSTLKGYHLHKTQLAEQQGIKLVHIRSDLWKNDKDEIRSLIQQMITKQFDFSKKYDLTQELLKIDRSIFNKCWKIPNFTLFKEMPPEIVLSLDGKYHYENCGYLIFKKIR